MDRHTCKLCLRRFASGRALGGHMRFHVAAGKMAVSRPPDRDLPPSPSSVSASHEEQEAEAADPAVAEVDAMGGVDSKQLAYYGLRENPRKSYRLVDPEFSSTFAAADYGSAAAAAGSSVVLQDRESETESSKPPALLLRRRSGRRRRLAPQLPPPTKTEQPFDAEPVSSVSDTTPEEDVARCLMMLSRDVWTSATIAKRKKTCLVELAGDEEYDGDEEARRPFGDGSAEKHIGTVRSRKGGRRRYQCGTCGKMFRSYQALGGHRAGHKNSRVCSGAFSPARVRAQIAVDFDEDGGDEHDDDDEEHGNGHLSYGIQDAVSEVHACSAERKVHECPVCFRVFHSGQALGGHKRSHLAYAGAGSSRPTPPALSDAAAAAPEAASATPAHDGGRDRAAIPRRFAQNFSGQSLIDLNLPAPMEDEVEMSAVFDGEQ